MPYPSFTAEDELPAREAARLALDAAQAASTSASDSPLVRRCWQLSARGVGQGQDFVSSAIVSILGLGRPGSAVQQLWEQLVDCAHWLDPDSSLPQACAQTGCS